MTETEFKKHLINQYKSLSGAEDPSNYSIAELQIAIKYQEKFNALEAKQKEIEASKPKGTPVPEIKGINGAKENSSNLKTDILETIQSLSTPEYDHRVMFFDEALKKDNSIKAIGDEDEVIILRDINGRMT